MHALNSGEVYRYPEGLTNDQSIAQVKLRMMKAIVETTSQEPSKTVMTVKTGAK